LILIIIQKPVPPNFIVTSLRSLREILLAEESKQSITVSLCLGPNDELQFSEKDVTQEETAIPIVTKALISIAGFIIEYPIIYVALPATFEMKDEADISNCFRDKQYGLKVVTLSLVNDSSNIRSVPREFRL
jgi:hypothetical protein